jgi:hypothetical protein
VDFYPAAKMEGESMNWVFVGSLGTGERVYFNADLDSDGNVAVEKDHTHLVDPTPEEWAEILKTMSHVRALIKKHGNEGTI